MRTDFFAETLVDTRAVAASVLSELKQDARAASAAVVLTLSGPLGVGKTAFSKCVAELLKVSLTVTSPSFVLRNDYPTDDAVFSLMSHIDAYRMEDSDEILSVGWLDLLERPHTLVVLEWPERIGVHVPKRHYALSLSFSGSRRAFSFSV